MKTLAAVIAILCLSAPVSAANILSYGAVGNGAVDNTAAIQQALDSNWDVYIPAGTFCVGRLALNHDHIRIHGDGPASILQFTAGAGALITGGPYAVSLSDVLLVGDDDSQKMNTVNPTSSAMALNISSQSDSVVDRVTIHGFGEVGIYTNDSATNQLSHLRISNSTIYNCWDALLVNGPYSEYVLVTNTEIHHNRYGLDIEAGNFSGSNVRISSNGYGVYLYGGRDPNNGHGNLTGSQINHSTMDAIYASGITIGFNFTGNQIADGPIYFGGCTGINLQGGAIDVQEYDFDGGGANQIEHNFIYGAYANTVNHNYNGHPDATVWASNFQR